MAYEVNVTEVFRDWYEDLSATEQDSVEYVVNRLIEAGPALSFPYSSGIKGSKFSRMRELRIQHQGRPYRVLYAFDPRRSAVLILGGDKTGDDRWYDKAVPRADVLLADYLDGLER
jgi:hypothetical protein